MTPEEPAAYQRGVVSIEGRINEILRVVRGNIGNPRETILAHLHAAVAEEREACAKEVESYHPDSALHIIAFAIRARGQQEVAP